MNNIRPTSGDAILEAAFQTFSQRPGASLGDVARHAGVARATLHRQFSSRQALMVAMAHVALEELNTAVDAIVANATSHSEGLKLALNAIIPLADRQWFLAHEPVEIDPDIAAAYQQSRNELYTSIDAAREEGTFAVNIPTKWIAETYDNLIVSGVWPPHFFAGWFVAVLFCF